MDTAATALAPLRVADRLSLPRKLGFTLGDYACNIYWQSLSLFLLFFYTDVVGLSAATAGWIYMVASIWDGAIDPLIGAVADRTRSRFGRYRPYILFGSVPLAVSFCLLYYTPPFEGTGLVVWLLATHIMLRTAYAVLNIPFMSLNARMTTSSSERSTLAGFRMLFATLAGLTVAYSTQPLVARFAGTGQGFMATAAVLALLATALFPIVFAATREPPMEASDHGPARLRDYWDAVRANRAFWTVMLAVALAAICATAWSKSILYYFKYYLADEGSSRLALSLNAAAGLVIIPIWMVASRYLGKRNAWFVASAIGLAGLVVFALTDVRSAAFTIGLLLYMQVAFLGLFMTFWSMMPDTVEYGEWRSGVRAESFVFGFAQFFMKAALGFGAGLFGWALDWVGYLPNVAQSAQTLAGMKNVMVFMPAIGIVMGIVAIALYPMGRGEHERIVAEIEARKR